jgi:hypothetical protein
MNHKSGGGTGLAWYLAWEFCMRFYASHGICPWVIEHDDLGYYGIQLGLITCKINPSLTDPIGRMTAMGNVENWVSGTPGDHGLNTIEMCDGGVETDRIVAAAIRHMKLPVYSDPSHRDCRHRRRGKTYELMFTIATILALKTGQHTIWNSSFHTEKILKELDPDANKSEHLGAFIF